MMVASRVRDCPFLDTLLDIFVFDFNDQDALVDEKLHREFLHLPLLRVSDTGNSKLGESTWLICSTGLLMHDLIIDFDK